MENCTCTDVPITIFRGDDTDGLGYQSIKGKITTVLDLTGCKAVFRYLGFTQTIDPIPESGRFIITIPSDITAKFPPGMGFASLRVYDQQGKVRTFTNRIPVFVTMTAPAVVGGDFTVEFSGGALNLEPLKIWTVNGFVDYDGYIERIIDKATADRFGLAMLKDTFESGDDADSGIAATPKSVNAAYSAILGELTDNYYTAQETDEAINSLAAYYITSNAAGDAFPTKNALVTATTYYSGGVVRVPTRNDYAVVLADETHGGAEWRYIYATNGQSGQWEAQYPIETNDYEGLSNKPQINGVTLSGNKTSAELSLLGTSDVVWPSTSASDAGKAADAKATGDALEPLLFAQYYPDGSVKSTAEFRSDIKYNFDTTNYTATVKPFCATSYPINDNSSLVGRVVIPPFVDAQGNPYIFDDGTRFKVVGVSGGNPAGHQNALTAIVAPNTMTNIGFYAFTYCDSLKAVSFPAVQEVGAGSFAACDSLISANLPAANTFGSVAFSGCGSLASVSLPAATNLSSQMFRNCASLASVDFGATLSSVPALGLSAFSGVPTSCKIIVPDSQYDAWIAASGWSTLYADGYQFLRHSEWKYARKYELDGKLGNSGNQTLNGTLTVQTSDLPDGSERLRAGDFGFDYNGTIHYHLGGNTEYLLQAPQASGILALLSDMYAAVQQIAPDFTAKAYALNDLCSYNGVVYRCKSAYTATAQSTKPDADTTHWEAKKVSELFLPLTGGEMTGGLSITAYSGARIATLTSERILYYVEDLDTFGLSFPFANGTLALLQHLAANYSTSATYALNQLCVHNGKLYRCTTAITTVEAWTAAHWTEATVEDVLAIIRSALNDKAPLASPEFTGTPTAPTAAAGTNTTQVATTAFVKTAVDNAQPNLDYVMRVNPETGEIYYTTPDVNA